MRTIKRLALAAVLLLSSSGVGAQPFAPESGVDAAKPPGYPVVPGIWKLHGQQPGLPTNDLEPLRRMIGRASVVALGESQHSSAGFYTTKHRVFRFLVEKMGFRVFAIESPWTRADDVENYIQTCQGTPEEALRDQGIWASTEMADFVRWMCEWNRGHSRPADKIHYFGFDIQQSDDDGPALVAFLQRIGIPQDHGWIQGIDQCEGVTRNHPFGQIPQDRHDRCVQTLTEIDGHFRSNGTAIRQQTSPADFEIAKLQLVGLRSYEDQIFTIYHDYGAGYTSRDVGMAYAFLKLREMRYPKAKTMIWAANSHVSESVQANGALPMGMHLAKALGRDYVSFALAAHVTEIDFLSFGCGPVERIAGSADERLDALGPDTLLVDFAFPGTRRPYLPTKGLLYIGHEEFELKRHFNGMFWMRHSPKMHPLLWPDCG